MNMKYWILILAVLLGAAAFLIYSPGNFFKTENKTVEILSTPEPTPIVLKQALPADAYTIVMVGDSMTEALGPNADKLREYLKIHYPNKVFGIYNLAEGSTNLLSLQEKIDKDILSREFEVILIESFGYNPLSGYSLEGSLPDSLL